MTEQAKQVPLIERLEAVPAYARLTIHDGHYSTSYYPVGAMTHEAAAELRQLHEVNTELLEACQALMTVQVAGDDGWLEALRLAVQKARAAIARAEDKT
jgi:hypothetical protein